MSGSRPMTIPPCPFFPRVLETISFPLCSRMEASSLTTARSHTRLYHTLLDPERAAISEAQSKRRNQRVQAGAQVGA